MTGYKRNGDGDYHRTVFLSAYPGPWVCVECNKSILVLGRQSDSLSVHHVNEDKLDNRLDNLVPMHNGCHKRHHATGRVLSSEAKTKISDSHKGELNPFYGKKHSDSSREKMSKSLVGREFSAEHRARLGESNRRRIVSPETRAKMSASAKARRKRERGED